jgi:hypothetical protein
VDAFAAAADKPRPFNIELRGVPNHIVRAFARAAARPRERRLAPTKPRASRAASKTRAAARSSDDPDLPLAVIPPAEFQRVVRDALAARALLAWSRSLGDAA